MNRRAHASHRRLTAILTALWIGCAAPILHAEPALVCAEPHHDFGSVSDRQEVSCTFIVANTGTTELVISRVQTSCSCIVPDNRERRIAPGTNDGIEVTFKLKGLHGPQRKSFYLQTNDRTASYYRLSLAVDIRQALNVRPDSIFFGQLSDDYESLTRTVQIEADREAAVTITGLETNDLSFCRATVETLAEKQKYRITLALPAGVLRKSGIFKGTLGVLTDHPAYPRIAIPVTAIMRKSILVTPQTILVKPQGTPQSRNLTVRSTQKGDIESITAQCPGEAQAAIERLSATQYLIRLTNLNAAQMQPDQAIVLTVKLASGPIETLHVPIEIPE